MFSLFLLRHGMAEPTSSQGDSGRRLTVRGLAQLREAAAGMSRMELTFDLGLHSPLRRARETAEVVWQTMGLAGPMREDGRLASGMTPGLLATLVDEASLEVGPSSSVLVVGHMPDLCVAVSYLTRDGPTGVRSFSPGGLARVDFGGRVAPSQGTLAWYLGPEALARAKCGAR